MLQIARLHTNLLFTLLAVLAALSVALFIRAARNQDWSRWVQAGLAVMQLLLMAECGLGVLLWLQGQRPARPETHIMYGLIAVAVTPLMIGWVRGRPARQAQFILGIVCIFLCALVLRSLQTARIS